ncbi:fumarate hydratase C-terminal domain-containing protein [Enterovibrio norvegicus]
MAEATYEFDVVDIPVIVVVDSRGDNAYQIRPDTSKVNIAKIEG